MNQIKLGVIGGGINSAVGYAHFCATNLDSNFLYYKGFFSRNNKINKESANKYKIEPQNLFYCLDDIITKSFDIDCWLVLTPTPTHFDVLTKLHASRKPIICEKALCSSLEEAEKLNDLFQDQDLFVVFNYTGYPMIREAREMLMAGKLGELITLNFEMPQSGFIKRSAIGVIPKPQDWRLQDDKISTISLDLGVHLHSLLSFICNMEPMELSAFANSFGLEKGIIDNIIVSMSFDNGALGNFWYSKTALGQTNGLKFRIFGTLGSIEWVQHNPNQLIFSDSEGNVTQINLSNNNLLEANKLKYNRFKPGHPAGFIEALANYYNSIFEYIISKESKQDLISLKTVESGMHLMDRIQKSILKN